MTSLARGRRWDDGCAAEGTGREGGEDYGRVREEQDLVLMFFLSVLDERRKREEEEGKRRRRRYKDERKARGMPVVKRAQKE